MSRLQDCFVGSLAPQGAEDILCTKKPGSYLVRQSDLDPGLLLLSYVVGNDVKHVIVPELRGSPVNSKSILQRQLEDTSEEVLKLLNSFGCKFPVKSESKVQPSSFKVKTRPEEGALDRCSVCTFEGPEIKKVKKHKDSHRVGYCPSCDSYFLQKSLAFLQNNIRSVCPEADVEI